MPRYAVLIALQINEWNENRKAMTRETTMLTAILENLKEDELQLKQNETRLANSVKAIYYLKEVKLQDIIPDTLYKRLAELIYFDKYHPIDNAYESLKSAGITLSNQELHNKLSKHYEYEQNVALSGINDIEIQYYSYFEPFLREHLRQFKWLVEAIPYELDQDFIETLRPHLISSFDNNSSSLRDLRGFIQKSTELQTMISNELEQYKRYLK